MNTRALFAVLLWMAVPVQGFGQSPDTEAVTATVRAFHRALGVGDAAGALRLLAADAVILESGGRETRDEYAAHHLSADIEFARAVPMQHGALQITVSGSIAWASSINRLQGSFQNRPVDLTIAELMVLSRTASAWEIRAIHWSSR